MKGFVERFSLTDGQKEVAVETDLSNNHVVVRGKEGQQISINATTISKYTESLYSYVKTFGSPNKWKLNRPKYHGEPSEGTYYFKTDETNDNEDDLDEYRKTVNTIAGLEEDLEALVGITVMLASFTTGFLIGSGGIGFGAAVAAYLAALGYGVAAEQKANEIGLNKTRRIIIILKFFIIQMYITKVIYKNYLLKFL